MMSRLVSRSISLSIFESTKRNEGRIDHTVNVDDNKTAQSRVTSFIFCGVETDVTNQGVELVQTLPIIYGYEWASHDVGEFMTCFHMNNQLEYWPEQSYILKAYVLDIFIMYALEG